MFEFEVAGFGFFGEMVSSQGELATEESLDFAILPVVLIMSVPADDGAGSEASTIVLVMVEVFALVMDAWGA